MINKSSPSRVYAKEECKFYNKGKCEYFAEARAELCIFNRRCCMHIVKPLTECFYYQPKEK